RPGATGFAEPLGVTRIGAPAPAGATGPAEPTGSPQAGAGPVWPPQPVRVAAATANPPLSRARRSMGTATMMACRPVRRGPPPPGPDDSDSARPPLAGGLTGR